MRKRTLLRGRIESASPNDIDDIVLIEIEGSSHPWKRSFFEKELTDKLSTFLIYRSYDRDEIEGFIIFRKIEDIIEINNISVRERSRRKGLATLLMMYLIDTAERESVASVFLEVRESNNKAINFYRKFKFEQISIRKNYYKDPIENALVLNLKILK